MLIDMKKVLKIGALALSLVSVGASCQVVSNLVKTQGKLEITVTDGSSCNITPNVTSPSVTSFGKWVNFGSMTFGCKNANGDPLSATLGFSNENTVVKADVNTKYKAGQVMLVTNSNGEQLADSKYYFRTSAGDNVIYGAATDDEAGIFLADTPVAVTESAGEGTVGLEAYVMAGSAAQHFSIPLMVKAWN